MLAPSVDRARLAQPLPLRDYQRDCIKAIESAYARGVRRQVVTIATGGGKTVIFSHLISKLNRKTLVLAHTNELLQQARDKMLMVNPNLDVGIVNGFQKEHGAHVVVASIQSARQPETLAILKEADFELLIADECHHFAAESNRMVMAELGFDGTSDRLLVGWTATPFRSDERGLGEVFDEIVFEKSIGNLIEEGYLCPPRGVKVATDLDLKDLATRDWDYSSASLAKIMNTQELLGLTVQAYQENSEGRPTIAFGASVDHARGLRDAFLEAGISTALIHGEMLKKEREDLLDDYQNGDIDVLCNCSVLTEGFDAPHTSCIIVARPTKSRGLYQQMVGRGLRKHPGKHDCIVIDFNDTDHSLCSAVVLMPDAEAAHAQEEERKCKERKLKESLPGNLNSRLASAYIEFNLIDAAFNWKRDGTRYSINGTDIEIHIVPELVGKYRVVITDGTTTKLVADGLSFEYAFAAGEDIAKQYRDRFTLADKEAPWRGRPISKGQKAVFTKFNYSAGIDRLTCGQASDLMQSGALKRKVK
jgi:ATP-dependent helicase IRC3